VASDVFERASEAAAYVRAAARDVRPRAGVVLGSALGGFVDACEGARVVPYEEVPGLRRPTTSGHAGRLVLGRVAGLDVAILSGRLHYYEGYSLDEVTFPVRLLAALGIEVVVLTNSAGGIDPSFRAGDLMAIEDHINLFGASPLRGMNDDRLGPRFPDMTDLYDAGLRAELRGAADEAGGTLRSGVYAGVPGPSYETPAEIRMLAAAGASAVGMSTVPEAIVARHAGLKVVGVSCITNAAAGLSGSPLSHTEVLVNAERSAETMAALLRGFCRRLAV
jgi:purine-nucleoside phosphorylase